MYHLSCHIFSHIRDLNQAKYTSNLLIEFLNILIISIENIYTYMHIQQLTNTMHTKSTISSLKTTFTQQKSQFSQPVSLHRGQRSIPNKIDSQLAVAFSIPQQDVIQLFQDIASSLNFQMIESEQNYATAVKKPQKASILQLLNCLSWWGASNQVNAIKLTILNSPTAIDSSLKLCKIRSLSQPTQEVLAFIQKFKEKLQKIKGIVPSAYLFEPNSYTQQATYQNNSNPFHLEACSYYMFHKILTSSTGSEEKIHKKLQKALKDFFQAFKNIQESSLTLPTPMLNIIDIIRQIVQQIGKLFNFKQQTNQSCETIMPFMKIAVEKYVFDRTQTILKTMYLHKDKQITQNFIQKRNKILSKMTKLQIFQQVLLPKNLRQIQTQTPNPSNRGGIQFCFYACPQLQKIKQTSSPREKIKYCQLMYAQLKSYFYQKLKMKYQLSTMQDIIPVFIVVVLYTNLQNLRSELNIMIDYIHATDEDFQAEKRLLINLSESYNYIVRDWKIDE